MAITSDQVLHSLMSYYKARGKDFTFLLGDPIFRSQPLEDQVHFLQENAAKLSAGVSANTGYTKSERAHILSGAITGAVTTGIGTLIAGGIAAATSGHAKGVLAATGIAAGVGALGGAMLGGMHGSIEASRQKDSRMALAREIQNMAHNPSTENVIGTLSSTHPLSKGAPSAGQLAVEKLRTEIQGRIPVDKLTEVASSRIPHFYNNLYPAPAEQPDPQQYA
jgi:hypothetical protein